MECIPAIASASPRQVWPKNRRAAYEPFCIAGRLIVEARSLPQRIANLWLNIAQEVTPCQRTNSVFPLYF
jgi:hypothetical protein